MEGNIRITKKSVITPIQPQEAWTIENMEIIGPHKVIAMRTVQTIISCDGEIVSERVKDYKAGKIKEFHRLSAYAEDTLSDYLDNECDFTPCQWVVLWTSDFLPLVECDEIFFDHDVAVQHLENLKKKIEGTTPEGDQ